MNRSRQPQQHTGGQGSRPTPSVAPSTSSRSTANSQSSRSNATARPPSTVVTESTEPSTWAATSECQSITLRWEMPPAKGPVQKQPDPEAEVYELFWVDGRKRPGIARAFIETLYEPDVGNTPFDNSKTRFHPTPIGVMDILEKLYERGLAARVRKLKDIKVDKDKDENRSMIGGFHYLPKLPTDADGRVIVERTGPASVPLSQATSKHGAAENKGPNKFWYASAPQDRAYYDLYMYQREGSAPVMNTSI